MLLTALLQSVLLTGGTVHTMRADEAPAVMDVLITDDRIAAVGRDLAVPADAQRIDVAGLHLVPGLIDGMVNHDADHDRLYVSAGVTLVRDAGNELARILSERDRHRQTGARERGPGPAILSAGAVLDGVPPSTTSAVVMTTVDEAKDKLARLFEFELDYVSIQPGLPLPVWRQVLETAHAKHLQVWGAIPRGATLADALAAGQDGLFHMEALLPAGKGWDKVTYAELEPVLDKLKGAKLAVTPMLGVFARRLVAPKTDPPELAYLGPFYRHSWNDDLEQRRKVVDEHFLRTGMSVLEMQSRVLRGLHERGVTLVPGSASPNPWLFPGMALVDELKMWSRAGIPAATVLRMATAGAARALAADKDRGTLEAGKIADIVAVRADPEADLEHLRSPALVVLRGRVLDRATLDGLRAELLAVQKQVLEASAKPLEIAAPALPIGTTLLEGSHETRALGERISGERWSVVERYDKSLSYCGRLLTPGSATGPATELEITQTIRDGFLAEFDLVIKSGARTITIKGQTVAGILSIERRINDTFVDNVPVKERLAFVDVGSVGGALALGHHREPGMFRVLYFEDFAPATARWELRLDESGTHLLKVHDGELKARFDKSGALIESMRVQGQGIAITRALSIKVIGGKGLPLPESKAALLPEPKPEPKSEPADPAKPAKPAPGEPKRDG